MFPYKFKNEKNAIGNLIEIPLDVYTLLGSLLIFVKSVFIYFWLY